MARSRIHVEGIDEVRKALRAVGDDAINDLKAAHAEAALIVEKRAETLVPVRTGTLRNSIRSSGTKTRGQVRAGSARVPYAGPIHFGWRARNIKPQPFLYDAADQRRDAVVDAYRHQLDVITRKHGLD